MRFRPRDPQKELVKAERDLADAEHELREMSYRNKKPSMRMKKQAEIDALKARILQLREVVG